MSYAFHKTHVERRATFGVPFCRRCKASKRDVAAAKPCPGRN